MCGYRRRILAPLPSLRPLLEPLRRHTLCGGPEVHIEPRPGRGILRGVPAYDCEEVGVGRVGAGDAGRGPLVAKRRPGKPPCEDPGWRAWSTRRRRPTKRWRRAGLGRER